MYAHKNNLLQSNQTIHCIMSGVTQRLLWETNQNADSFIGELADFVRWITDTNNILHIVPLQFLEKPKMPPNQLFPTYAMQDTDKCSSTHDICQGHQENILKTVVIKTRTLSHSSSTVPFVSFWSKTKLL